MDRHEQKHTGSAQRLPLQVFSGVDYIVYDEVVVVAGINGKIRGCVPGRTSGPNHREARWGGPKARPGSRPELGCVYGT